MVIRLVIPGLNIPAQVFSSIRRQVYPVLQGNFRQCLEAQRTLQMPVQVYLRHPVQNFPQFAKR
jgi:hypothetical protein